MTERAAATTMPIAPVKKTHSFGYGAGYRRRKALPAAPEGKTDQQLIEEFLRRREPTKCPTRYADGAVKESGYYHFG